MQSRNFLLRFTGEITAQDELSANSKGGSLAAVLKRSITHALGIGDAQATAEGEAKSIGRLTAATVEIDGLHRLLIMAPQGVRSGTTYRVRRTGKASVEITLEDDNEFEVDEVMAAFVELKRRLLLDGKVKLTAPMTADEFERIGSP